MITGSRLIAAMLMLMGSTLNGEIPAAVKALSWKKYAQEVSKNPEFQSAAKTILADLPDTEKESVRKTIAQVVAGKGAKYTGTKFDHLLAGKLRTEAARNVVGDNLLATTRLTDEEILALASSDDTAPPPPAAEAGPAKVSDVVKILLAEDPKVIVDAPDSGRVVTSRTGSRLRLVPGLADSKCVSIAPPLGRNMYLMHDFWKVWVRERPPGQEHGGKFDGVATFKMIQLDSGKVRFEAYNLPGEFLMVDEEGKLALSSSKNPPRIDFQLKVVTEGK